MAAILNSVYNKNYYYYYYYGNGNGNSNGNIYDYINAYGCINCNDNESKIIHLLVVIHIVANIVCNCEFSTKFSVH